MESHKKSRFSAEKGKFRETLQPANLNDCKKFENPNSNSAAYFFTDLSLKNDQHNEAKN